MRAQALFCPSTTQDLRLSSEHRGGAFPVWERSISNTTWMNSVVRDPASGPNRSRPSVSTIHWSRCQYSWISSRYPGVPLPHQLHTVPCSCIQGGNMRTPARHQRSSTACKGDHAPSDTLASILHPRNAALHQPPPGSSRNRSGSAGCIVGACNEVSVVLKGRIEGRGRQRLAPVSRSDEDHRTPKRFSICSLHLCPVTYCRIDESDGERWRVRNRCRS